MPYSDFDSSSEKIEILEAKTEDLDICVEMVKELFSLETDYQFDPQKAFTAFSLILKNPAASTIMLVKKSNKIVAMASVQLVISSASGASAAWIEDVFVNKNYRRLGLGNLVLKACKTWAENKGARRMQLLVDKRNENAMEFYKAFGFSPSNMNAQYYYF